VRRKGGHWQLVPLDPDVADQLRTTWMTLQPDAEDHVFTVEVEQWVSQYERRRRRKDPRQPASDQALMRMVWRVCRRAGIKDLSPHQLRHGFANRFLRESGRDLKALQAILGHSRSDTTEGYVDDIDLDELAEALGRAAATRHAQASPELTTLEMNLAKDLRELEWRRRESNPRPSSLRQSVYKLRPPLEFARRPVGSRPTAGLAILWCRASGDWLSLGAEPVR
jgi:integrase-like protein